MPNRADISITPPDWVVAELNAIVEWVQEQEDAVNQAVAWVSVTNALKGAQDELRELRRAAVQALLAEGFNQPEVGGMLGVSKSRINRIANGTD